MRIRWQSFVDPTEHPDYFELLQAQLQRAAGEGVTYEVIGMQPPDRDLHRLSETRCGARAVANAIAAERGACDGFAIGHFQDSGLHEARSAVGIPVLGLGESSMLHSCTLGQRIGLVTIHPIFIPWHREQILRYGLSQRVVDVVAMSGLSVADYARACGDDQAFARVFEQFERVAAPLLDAGVEVLIPAGGLPAMALSRRSGLEIGGAAVLNPVPVLAKHTEAAVALALLGLPVASRRGAFALPSERCRDDFLAELG